MIEIDVDASRAHEALQKLGKDVGPALGAAVLRAAHTMASIVSQVVVEKFPEGTSQLARSFVANVGFTRTNKGGISARTFSPLPYAAIQDKGGVVRPKTARALAVPISKEAERKWPRDWSRDRLKLIVLRGKALLVEVLGKGKSAKLKTHYVLKDQVTLKGREYIAAAKDRGSSQVDRIMREALATLVKGGVK